jgi:hypothetical protein
MEFIDTGSCSILKEAVVAAENATRLQIKIANIDNTRRAHTAGRSTEERVLAGAWTLPAL